MLAACALLASLAISLFIFGFIKFVHDLKMQALRAAKNHYDSHFSNLEKFVNDPASPQELITTAIEFSEAANNINFGRFALACLHDPKFAKREENDSERETTMKILTELESYRPDLVKLFADLLKEGHMASIYRYISGEISPWRAFKELKTAQEIETRRRNDTVRQSVLALGSLPLSYLR